MNKKFLTSALCALLVGGLLTTGTFAYFTDKDSKTNVFTSGNVKIEQLEKDRDGEDFVQNQKLLPAPTSNAKDAEGYYTDDNYIDKYVTVKNNGSEAAYVRTYIAVPAILEAGAPKNNILHWNYADNTDEEAGFPARLDANGQNEWFWDNEGKNATVQHSFQKTLKVNGKDILYNIYVATYNEELAKDQITAPSLMGLYLDKRVDFDGAKYTMNGADINFDLTDVRVLVATEAVQADGFDNAFDALDAAFGEVGSYVPGFDL